MAESLFNESTQRDIDLSHRNKNPDAVILVPILNACAQLQTNEALYPVKKTI